MQHGEPLDWVRLFAQLTAAAESRTSPDDISLRELMAPSEVRLEVVEERNGLAGAPDGIANALRSGEAIKGEIFYVVLIPQEIEANTLEDIKASGQGFFFGRESLGSFQWLANSEIEEDEIITATSIEGLDRDQLPASVVEGIQGAAEDAVAMHLVPPGHVMHAWFQQLFANNDLNLGEAWHQVMRPDEFVDPWSEVDTILESCWALWPDLTWPSDPYWFVGFLMDRLSPGQPMLLMLRPRPPEGK